MSRPTATIDTSVLVSLQSAELLGAVSVLFERLLVPSKVREELGDQGEAEAVIQAAMRPTNMVLADDRLAREWASRHAKECHGTIWICHELRDKGYLNELRPYYIRMLRCGRRQPRKEMNDHLLEFREPPITEQEFRDYTSQPQA